MNLEDYKKYVGKKFTFFDKEVTVKDVRHGGYTYPQIVLLQDKNGVHFELVMSTFLNHCKPVLEAPSRTSDAWFFVFMKNLVAGYYDHNLAQNQIATIKDIRTLYSNANPNAGTMPLMDAKNLMEMAREWRKLGKNHSATNEAVRTELRHMEDCINVIRRELAIK